MARGREPAHRLNPPSPAAQAAAAEIAAVDALMAKVRNSYADVIAV
jgi:hypothetical protein